MSSLLHDLGVWCFRRAKTVVALWLVLLALREHAATATIAVSDLVEVTQAVFDFRVLAAMASGRQADIDRMTNQLTMMVLTFVHPM